MSTLSPASLNDNENNITLCKNTNLTGCPSDDAFTRFNLTGVSNVPSNVQQKGGKRKTRKQRRRRRRQHGGNYGFELTEQNKEIIGGRDGTYVPTVGVTNCTLNYVLDKANLNASDPNEPFLVSGKYSSATAAPIPSNEVNKYESNYNNMKGGYSKDLIGYKYPGHGMSKNAGVPDPKGNPLLEAVPSVNTVDVAQYTGVAKDQNKLFYGSYAPVTQVKRGGAKKSRKARKSRKGRKSRKVHKKHQSKKHRKQHKKKSRKSRKHRKQRGGAGLKPLSPHGFETSSVDPSNIVKTAPSWSNVPSSPGYGMADKSMVPSESWLGSQPMPIKQQNQNGTGNCVDNYNHFKAGTKKV